MIFKPAVGVSVVASAIANETAEEVAFSVGDGMGVIGEGVRFTAKSMTGLKAASEVAVNATW